MTHTGELHDKIVDQTSKARRSTREVKVPIYFSITTVLLRFKPKGLTKQCQTKRSHHGTSGRRYLSDPPKDWEGLIGVRPPTAYETPIRTWWNTKAWSELSPLGLPQLSMGLGATSGNQ